MTLAEWKLRQIQKQKRIQERLSLESQFNAEIVRLMQAGQTKEQIVANLGISRELFNRVMRTA